MAKKVNLPQSVAISEIILDQRYQMRVDTSKPTVERYKEFYEDAHDRLPPVKCIKIGEKFFLVEGFLRVEAAKRAGLKEIQVIVLEGDENDGLWHAVGSNKHGMQLSWGDMKKVVNISLDAFPNKKNVELARHIGCSEGYIRKIKKERIDEEDRTSTNSDETNEEKEEDRTSTISEKKFEALLGKIKETVTSLSPEQKDRFRQEIQSLLDDGTENNEVKSQEK